MLKSGLIVGGVMFVLAIGGSLLSPFCVPCLALFAGLGAGYLASLFDKPGAQNAAVRAGTGAGAVGGIGGLVGQFIGGGINAVVVGPEGAAELLRNISPDFAASSDPTSYYAGVFISACCIGLFNLALMAGLGALGGVIWWAITGKNQSSLNPPSALSS